MGREGTMGVRDEEADGGEGGKGFRAANQWDTQVEVMGAGWGLSTRLSIGQKVSADDADDSEDLSSEVDSLAGLNSDVQ
jgi:hypothetical protein